MKYLSIDDLTHAVIGAAMEVHSNLGPGFLENIYEEALAIELVRHNIPFEKQKEISVHYKGQAIGQSRLDFLVDQQLIVELKAVEQLAPIHTAQVISYLRITNFRLALLLNFNVKILKQGLKRIVLD